MALTPKQQRFVDEYCTDWNATQAAIRAGYRAKRADQAGYQLLRKAEIQAAIQARQQELAGQCAVTQERVVQELAGIAFSDLRHYLHWGPAGVTLERSSTLTPAQARVVKQLVQTVTRDGSTLRITLHALDKLARHLGLYQGHDPEEELIGPKQVAEARQELLDRLNALAERAQQNGQGEG